ncbi:MAG: hypothetical protein K2Q12_04740 [Rickettsiales bacterium]|nr:hypothetical protein [Rickettsiales bacterium]
MRWTDKHKADYVRTVETVSVIEDILNALFGMIQLETGSHTMRDGVTRVDYVLNVSDYEAARVLSRELQFRHVSSGVRPESGRYVLRVSKNDLMEAFAHPKSYTHAGKTVRDVLEERVAQRQRMGLDLGFLPESLTAMTTPLAG